jgi:hypothetical protein
MFNQYTSVSLQVQCRTLLSETLILQDLPTGYCGPAGMTVNTDSTVTAASSSVFIFFTERERGRESIYTVEISN